MREMATSYGRSPGGYLWAIAEPVAGIVLLTLVLSLAFQAPPLGISFPLFYATGLVPFLAYVDLSSKTAQSINFSRALLSYPAVNFIDALIARFALNAMVQIVVGLCIFSFVLLAMDTRALLDPRALGLAIAMLGALAWGIGVMNCLLLSKYPIWQRVWGILNRPLFIISCIFFTFDVIPAEYQKFLWWNPLVHIVGQMRSAFYPTYAPDYISALYVFALSLSLATTGLFFLWRYHRDILEAR